MRGITPPSSFMLGVTVVGAVSVLSCGGEAAGPDPAGPSEPRRTVIAMVSGNDQRGVVGRSLCEPLMVRVTNADHVGLGGVTVTWTVTSGNGVFVGQQGTMVASPQVVRTLSNGNAYVVFAPTLPGWTRVRAETPEAQGSQVDFAVNAAASDWPGVTGPARIYERVLTACSGVPSRYVLFDDRRFELQYTNGFSTAGTYSTVPGTGGLAFAFSVSKWAATGAIRGDSLWVLYNEIAQLEDFENGLYLRADAVPRP